MAFFSRESVAEKNNTLLTVTIIFVLFFACYVLIINDDLMGILISLFLIIGCGVAVMLLIE